MKLKSEFSNTFISTCSAIDFAQERTVTVVFDESGMPIPGVSVLLKGTTFGTQTDFDGNLP
jgi:hypothetical protein